MTVFNDDTVVPRDLTSQESYTLAYEQGTPAYNALVAEIQAGRIKSQAATASVEPAPQTTGLSVPPNPALVWLKQRSARQIAAGAIIIVGLIILIAVRLSSGGSSIAAGDCVTTAPDVVSGYSISKVDCSTNTLDNPVQQVQSVLSGSQPNGCPPTFGGTTFMDDPAGKTYCLVPYYNPNNGG